MEHHVIDLSGKVAIVTGAAHKLGQGAASARILAQHGAAVVLADIDLDESEARAEEIRHAGADAIAIHADVRNEEQVERMVRAAVTEFGRLDVLHSQAADLALLGDPGDPPIAEMSADMWRTQFETIVLGTMLSCKHAIPAMLETGGGSIICTSSISGMMGEPNLTVYAAAKAAVNQVIRSVSAQYGKQGIRANAIAPGLILTAPGLALGEALIAQYARHCDTTYVGQPEDTAHLVAFLASDLARYITGEVIRVDGGFNQHSPMLAEQIAEGRMLGA
jgi:NAD(P)-dependent dehydrogenase (short-subunit alcohol dehydrogenase family)